MEDIATYLIPAGVILFLLLTIGLMFSRLYKKSSKKMAFVRTGLGGEKVIMNGGAIILKVIHEVMNVNMETIRITVERKQSDSLITKNRMRVDITVEFYVRVKQSAEAISKAAQTLGEKTLSPNELRPLIEGKFVDALRSVAAKMDMDNLHEERKEFIQEVQAAVFEDLIKNGLELETVSLIDFNQTDLSYFNEDNAFDAEGLILLTRRIENSKKERNDIQRENELLIQDKDLVTKKESLRLDQEREMSIAKQASEVKTEQAIRSREAEEATISAEKAIEEARIDKEKTIESKEIEKSKALASSRIDKEKTIAIQEQIKQIEISQKSQEESVAKADANAKKAVEITSQEQIQTAKDTEEANRNKALTIIKAEESAEREAIGKKVAAAAEKAASEDLADAKKIVAQGNADAITIEAEANKIKYQVDAEGREKLNEAENKISKEVLDVRVKEALISNMPNIIASVVKPMENIDSIKIIDMGGKSGDGLTPSTTVGSTNGSISDQIVNSALKYKTHAPIVESLMSEIGLDLNSVDGLTKPLTSFTKDFDPRVETSSVKEPIKEFIQKEAKS